MPNKFTKENVLNFLREVSVMSIAANLNDKSISSVVAFAIDQDFSFTLLQNVLLINLRHYTKTPK